MHGPQMILLPVAGNEMAPSTRVLPTLNMCLCTTDQQVVDVSASCIVMVRRTFCFTMSQENSSIMVCSSSRYHTLLRVIALWLLYGMPASVAITL